jgi:dihydroorotase-like cyclic amidohydrolase
LLLTDECVPRVRHQFQDEPAAAHRRRRSRLHRRCERRDDRHCLATDHAPHLAEEKELEFAYAPFGIIGLECALPLYVKALVEPGHITWMQMIEMMTSKSARL